MAGLLKPFATLWTPGQVKPQGVPRIDWSHTLARGLIFYGFDCGDGNIIDLVRGRIGTPTGTIQTGSTAWGTGINWGAASQIYFASDAEIRAADAAPPWTCASAFVAPSTPANSAVPFGRTANNFSFAPYRNWAFQYTTTTPGYQYFLDSLNSGVSIGSNFSNTNNAFTSLALVANSSSSASAFGNGVQSGTTTTGLTIQSTNTNDDIIFSGTSSAGINNPWNGYVFYGAFWGRALTASELTQLHWDPYCFLLPSEGEMAALRGSSSFALAALCGFGVEALAGLQPSAAAAIEQDIGFAASRAIPAEARAGLAPKVAVAAGSYAGRRAAAPGGIELAGGVAAQALAQIEQYLITTAVGALAGAPLEVLGGDAGRAPAAAENLAAVECAAPAGLEFAAVLTRALAGPAETLGGVRSVAGAPAENLARVAAKAALADESLAATTARAAGVLEALAGAARSIAAAAELAAGLRARDPMAVEATAWLTARALDPLAFDAGLVARAASALAELLAGNRALALARLEIEGTGFLVIDPRLVLRVAAAARRLAAPAIERIAAGPAPARREKV